MAKGPQGWGQCEDGLPYYKDSPCSLPQLLSLMSSNNRGDLEIPLWWYPGIWFVERVLFKRGCVRVVGEHATAKSPRERVLAFMHSNPRGPLAATPIPGTGPLNFRCFMPSFLWLSPPATDPISDF
jgi:hypothetical protein